MRGNLRHRPEKYGLSCDSQTDVDLLPLSGGTWKVPLQDCCLPTHLSPAPSGPCALLWGAVNVLLLVLYAPVHALPDLTLGTSFYTCHTGCPAVGRDPCCLGAGLRDKRFLLGTQPGPSSCLECGTECERVVGHSPEAQLGSALHSTLLNSGFHQPSGHPWD